MNDYGCKDCGCTFDVPENENKQEYTCPDCGSGRWGLIPQRSNVAIKCDTMSWSTENGGKGRRISQLDYGVRQPYYAKSQSAAIDEAKRRGLKAEKV